MEKENLKKGNMKIDLKIIERIIIKKKMKEEMKKTRKDAKKTATGHALKNVLEKLAENKWIVILMKKAKNVREHVSRMIVVLKNVQKAREIGGKNLKIKMNLKNKKEGLKQEETAGLPKEKQKDLSGLEDGEIRLKKYSL